MAKLEVEIGADISGLTQALTKAEIETIKFGRGMDKAGNPVKKFGKTVNTNAVPAMTSFSQVIQDAPFGIQGVANNITQLTAQFGHLSKNAGGTKEALKGMLKTLSGPAGILLAVSVITSLMVAFQSKLRGTKNEVNQLTDATKDLIGAVGEQKETIEALLIVARDETRSLKDRERALKAAKKGSKGYLDTLNLENINTQTAIDLTATYTKVLIQQAKIKGVQKRISELFAKRYEIENKTLRSQITTWGFLTSAVKGFGNINNQVTAALVSGAENMAQGIKDVDKEVDTLTTALRKLISEDIDLEGLFSGGSGGGENFVPTSGQFVPGLKTIGKMIEKTWAESVLPTLKMPLFEFDSSKIRTEFDTVNKELLRFNEQLDNIIRGGIANTFADLGAVIGEGLTSGTNILEASGNALLAGLANVLIQLGQLAIATGVGMIALKIAFESFGGLGAIAAGVAMVALGSAVKGSIKKMGDGLGGGDAGGAGSGSSRFGGASSTFAGGFGGGRIVFELEGTKLIGVINNSIRQDVNRGGSIGLLNN